jgi:hypothetical protein
LFSLRELPWDREVRGHCKCKEMPVILVNKAVDTKMIIWEKWRAKEERQKVSLIPQKYWVCCSEPEARS